MIFNDYCTKFLTFQETELGNSPGEMAQKRMALRNHLAPHFGALDLSAIGKPEITTYVRSKKERYKPATINNHLALLSRMLRQALEDGYVQALPPIKLTPRREKAETNFLQKDELRDLLMAADLHVNPIWRVMMLVALNTGMRIGELLALDWSAVDMAHKRLTVRASLCRQTKQPKCTKNGKERVVALNDLALGALQKQADACGNAVGLVFPMEYTAAQKAMASTIKRAGIAKNVTWHTLRHTFASRLVMKGIPLFTVGKLLGHSSISMTERYAHLDTELAYKTVAMLEGSF